METWVHLCDAGEMPSEGEVKEAEAGGRQLCLVTLDQKLHVLENLCPHRQGPLGQGWVEGNAVLCPWHAWAFDVCTGVCTEPERAQVKVFPTRLAADSVQVDLS